MLDLRQMLVVISLWWVANIITTRVTEYTIGAAQPSSKVNGSTVCGWVPAFKDLRWLELTTLQQLFGAVTSVLVLKIVKGKSTPIWPSNSDSSKATGCIAIVANIVGNLAINLAIASSPAGLSTRIVTVGEPILTFFLSLFIYSHDDFNWPTLFSVLTMTFGVTWTWASESTSFKMCGFLAAFLSSFWYTIRNIHLKKLSWESVLQKYAVVSIGSILLLVPATLLKLVIMSTHINSGILSGGVIASIFHFIYNAASITVLEDVSPLTHAILNLSRQVCVIIINIIYFNSAENSLFLITGLVIFILGFALYIHYKANKNYTKYIGRITTNVLLLACLLFIGVNMSRLKLFSGEGYRSRTEVKSVTSTASGLRYIVNSRQTTNHLSQPTTSTVSGPKFIVDNQGTTADYSSQSIEHFRSTTQTVKEIYATTLRAELKVTVTNSANLTHNTLSPNPPSQQLSKNQRIVMAWVFERNLPQVVLNNIRSLQTMNPDSHIHVYCGTSQCIRALTNFSVTTEFLVVSELVKDTPLELWVARHPLNKVLAGIEFEHHLQIVTQLGILWQHGGIYVNPMVTIADNTKLPSCQNGWISKDYASSTWDISCFPKNHPLIQNIMENFVHDYPRNYSASEFSLKDVIEDAYNEMCTSNNDCPSQVNLKYTVNKQSTSLHYHYGTLSYDVRVNGVKVVNLGDEVQGFPGMQFLPFVDQFVERDDLSQVMTKEPVTIFFNAWWGNGTMIWPPPNNVHPIMTSIHIEGTIRGLWNQKIDYLNANAPIGCRDISTLEFLQKKNVDSYFSGCLTLMLKNPNVFKIRTDKIFLVDVKHPFLKLLPTEIQDISIPVKHYVHTENSLQRFSDAFKLLESYASAKLVVTQRIHCALPCVAMGIPVVFINSAGMPGGGGSKNHSSTRIVGLTPLFNTVDMYKMSLEEAKKWFHDFDWNNPPPNPNVNMMMRMRATFWDVIRKNPVLYDAAHKFGMVPLHPPPALPSEHHELLFHLLFTTSSRSTVSLFGDGIMKGAFNWRHWRTVESIFHHHPFARVIVHSNTLQQSEFDVLTEAGYTIEVQSYNLEDMIRNSPAKDFMGKLESASKGGFWYSHLTDLLRLLVLYKWGGIYMDTDMIVVRPVNSLKNVLGYQSANGLNGAFMAFEKDNPYIRDCLDEYAHNYRGSKWSSNGPSLVTRIYKGKWRNSPSVVNTLKQNAFYMFHFQKIRAECFEKVSQHLFDLKMKVLKEEAYAVHLNSKITGKKGINDKLEDGTLCKYILNTYCVLCDRQY